MHGDAQNSQRGGKILRTYSRRKLSTTTHAGAVKSPDHHHKKLMNSTKGITYGPVLGKPVGLSSGQVLSGLLDIGAPDTPQCPQAAASPVG